MLYTSIPILFLIVGIVAGISFTGLVKLSRKYSFKWYSWAMTAAGLSLGLFTVAWSATSVLEKEPQAAGMGLVFFGLPAIALLFLSRRMILRDSE